MNRPAVFLDRDGTIIKDVHYVAKPEDVRPLPDAARAIARLNLAAIPVVVVTNQSGIARGLFTQAQADQVQRRVLDLLRDAGATIDATYVCPHHPEFTGPCDCRKPGTLLFRRAAEELGLDLARSWFIGDRLHDIAPARAFGGRGILVPTRETAEEEIAAARDDFAVARSLDEAVARVIKSAR